MSDTREILDKIFNGKMLIKRHAPRPGESRYYYLDPSHTDDYSTISDFGIVDVPDDMLSSSSVFAHQDDHSNREQGIQYRNSSSAMYAHTNNNDIHILPAQGLNKEEQTLWQDILHNGEYMANAGMQGLSLGWADEGEGLIHGSVYALMHHLYPRQDASGWDAFQRGYRGIRDQRRKNLQDGYEESPYLTGMAEVAGAYVSPTKLINRPSRTAPLSIKIKDDKRRTIYSGIAYGVGSSENSGDDYAKNVLSNVVGGMAGNKMSKGMFGVAGAPVAREITNLGVSTGVGTLVNKMVDMLCGDK